MAKRRNTGPGISFFAFQDIITAVVGIFILITLILVLELAQRVEAAAGGGAPAEDIRPVIETIAALEEQIENLEAEIDRRIDAMAESSDQNRFNRVEKEVVLQAQLESLKAQLDASLKRQQAIETQLAVAEKASKELDEQWVAMTGDRAELEKLSMEASKIEDEQNVLLGKNSAIYRDQTDDGRHLVLVTVRNDVIEIRDALTRRVQVFSGGDKLDQLDDWMNVVPLHERHLLIMIEPGGESNFETLEKMAEQRGARYGFTVVGVDHSVRLKFEMDAKP